MSRKNTASFVPVGAVSLMTVFGVVCLLVFALLSLSTALADRRLAEGMLINTEQYYEADLQAEEIFARLRAGEEVPGVRQENGIFSYQCPMGENRCLSVELECCREGWQVLRWQTVTLETAAEEKNLNVWAGAPQQEETP